MLLDACVAAARAAGFSRLMLVSTMPGEPLYRAYGFEALEPVEVSLPDGVVLPCTRMVRADMSAGAVTVRRGRPDDEASLLALADQLAAFPVPAWRTAREIQRADDGVLRDALGGAPGTAVFVAEGTRGNEGVVCLTTRRTTSPTRRWRTSRCWRWIPRRRDAGSRAR